MAANEASLNDLANWLETVEAKAAEYRRAERARLVAAVGEQLVAAAERELVAREMKIAAAFSAGQRDYRRR